MVTENYRANKIWRFTSSAHEKEFRRTNFGENITLPCKWIPKYLTTATEKEVSFWLHILNSLDSREMMIVWHSIQKHFEDKLWLVTVTLWSLTDSNWSSALSSSGTKSWGRGASSFAVIKPLFRSGEKSLRFHLHGRRKREITLRSPKAIPAPQDTLQYPVEYRKAPKMPSEFWSSF